MGKILSWGQNQVTLTPLGAGGTASVYKSIVQNSTQLETTEGEVTDAVIEGGEIEASRRAKSSYNLTFQVRIGGGDDTSNTDNIKDSDGVVDGEDWSLHCIGIDQLHKCGRHYQDIYVSRPQACNRQDGYYRRR